MDGLGVCVKGGICRCTSYSFEAAENRNTETANEVCLSLVAVLGVLDGSTWISSVRSQTGKESR